MAIVAMGGEGGGVLADWAVDLAEHKGYWGTSHFRSRCGSANWFNHLLLGIYGK